MVSSLLAISIFQHCIRSTSCWSCVVASLLFSHSFVVFVIYLSRSSVSIRQSLTNELLFSIYFFFYIRRSTQSSFAPVKHLISGNSFIFWMWPSSQSFMNFTFRVFERLIFVFISAKKKKKVNKSSAKTYKTMTLHSFCLHLMNESASFIRTKCIL